MTPHVRFPEPESATVCDQLWDLDYLPKSVHLKLALMECR